MNREMELNEIEKRISNYTFAHDEEIYKNMILVWIVIF